LNATEGALPNLFYKKLNYNSESFEFWKVVSWRSNILSSCLQQQQVSKLTQVSSFLSTLTTNGLLWSFIFQGHGHNNQAGGRSSSRHSSGDRQTSKHRTLKHISTGIPTPTPVQQSSEVIEILFTQCICKFLLFLGYLSYIWLRKEKIFTLL